MELIKYPSPNYGLRRDDTEIDFIILHYTAMGTENSLDRLCDPTHEVSCHYLIDQGGLCYQLVDDNKRAWHAATCARSLDRSDSSGGLLCSPCGLVVRFFGRSAFCIANF